MARRRIEKRHGGRVRHLAAQVQEVLGAETRPAAAPRPARRSRGSRISRRSGRFIDAPTERLSSTVVVPPETTTASWAISAGRKGQSDRGARMGVPLHMVGVDVDDAGNEDRAVEVEGPTLRAPPAVTAAMRPSAISRRRR
jgi:hypothetical protein